MKFSFVRYWIPELSSFPSKYIFEPHLAPLDVQISSNCIVGEDYPFPIVDRKETRKEIGQFKLSLEKQFLIEYQFNFVLVTNISNYPIFATTRLLAR